MRYYKNISNGYVISVGVGEGFTEITQEEYNTLLSKIHEKPTKDGYAYRLKSDLTWEEYEYVPIVFEEATEQDYQNALAEMGVDLNG